LEKAKISNFIKICPVGAELFHADRQTDMTKLVVAFHNFANAAKKEGKFHLITCHVGTGGE
jgi:23S rRNA A2030 N6-methylase RlmJ